MVDGGSIRVVIGGDELQFSGGSAQTDLSEGSHDLIVEFLQESSGDQVALGWNGAYGELLHRIAEYDPLRQQFQQNNSYETQYELDVGSRVQTKRMQMPNSGTDDSQRSLAVGLPSYRSFCFDANVMSIPYAWTGAFLDYGPMVAYGGGRGDSPGQPLGKTFAVGGVDYPLRFGNRSEQPEVEFQGYRESPYPAELYYTVDGTPVTQQVRYASEGLGLRYTFKLESANTFAMAFLTAENSDLERSASVGSWDGSTLIVTDSVREFSVTVTNTGVGR
jgi:hypothetical protein